MQQKSIKMVINVVVEVKEILFRTSLTQKPYVLNKPRKKIMVCWEEISRVIIFRKIIITLTYC